MDEDKNLYEVEVVENALRRPLQAKLDPQIDVMTSYSLFMNEFAEEIRSHVQQIEALAERIFRSYLWQQMLHSFFVPKQ